jgi:hypothetical protein
MLLQQAKLETLKIGRAMIACDCDLASEMRLLSTLAHADHGSSTADRLHGAQVS